MNDIENNENLIKQIKTELKEIKEKYYDIQLKYQNILNNIQILFFFVDFRQYQNCRNTLWNFV